MTRPEMIKKLIICGISHEELGLIANVEMQRGLRQYSADAFKKIHDEDKVVRIKSAMGMRLSQQEQARMSAMQREALGIAAK